MHGQILVDLGNYEDAVELLERSLELDPQEGMADYVESVRGLVE